MGVIAQLTSSPFTIISPTSSPNLLVDVRSALLPSNTNNPLVQFRRGQIPYPTTQVFEWLNGDQIRSKNNTNKCLQIRTVNFLRGGTDVLLMNCDNTRPEQKWQLVQIVTSGYLLIQSKGSNKCMQIYQIDSIAGTALLGATICNTNDPKQQFVFGYVPNNAASSSSSSIDDHQSTPSTDPSLSVLVLVVIGICFVLLLSLAVFFLWRSHRLTAISGETKNNNNSVNNNNNTANTDQAIAIDSPAASDRAVTVTVMM